MSILEDLYEGKVHPWDKRVCEDGEYRRIADRLADRMDELTTCLNEREKTLCDTIENDLADLSTLSQREYFIEGFRLGAQIMCEIYRYESGNLY